MFVAWRIAHVEFPASPYSFPSGVVFWRIVRAGSAPFLGRRKCIRLVSLFHRSYLVCGKHVKQKTWLIYSFLRIKTSERPQVPSVRDKT
jgi:hypothetical protein